MAAITTATLTIGGWYTHLTLIDDNGCPVSGLERINIAGDGAGWDVDPVGYLRATADSELTRLGYTRTGDWTYDAYRDAHLTTIAGA